MGYETCNVILNTEKIKFLLETNETYDVILMEQFNQDCMMPLAWKLQAPVIGLSSCTLMPWHFDRVGNPLMVSYSPGLFSGFNDDMSYYQRISNWFSVHISRFLYR